jgi:hypothetical protein
MTGKMMKILSRTVAPDDESDKESSDDQDGAVIGIRGIESDDSELAYSMDDFCVPEPGPEDEEISDGSVATAADLSQ